MKKVLITGSFKFPDKDAAALRVNSITKLFSNEFQIYIAGWEREYNGHKKYNFDGSKCFSSGDLEYQQSNFLINKIQSIFRGYKSFFWIIKQSTFDIIILYNPPFLYSIIMLFWFSFKKTKLVLDSTEWYEPIHLSDNYFSLARLESFLRMCLAYRLFKNVIVISSYLDNYYKRNNIVIPPIFQKKSYIFNNKTIDNEIIFLYAGQLGKKDKLDEFISVIPQISQKINKKIKLLIVGITNKEFYNITTNNLSINVENKYIECVGRVDRDEVEKFYSKAHFVVFFRENMRYAKAGFPSKSIESWQHGIPIITNNVGELKNYLKNGVNSFVLENNQQSILNLANELNLMISSKNYPLMVENSLKTFNDNFDLLKFKSEFLIYIESLK